MLYTVTFYNNNTQIGTTSSSTEDTVEVQDELNRLLNYFRSSKLATEALGVDSWTTLTITVTGSDYNFNR